MLFQQQPLDLSLKQKGSACTLQECLDLSLKSERSLNRLTSSDSTSSPSDKVTESVHTGSLSSPYYIANNEDCVNLKHDRNQSPSSQVSLPITLSSDDSEMADDTSYRYNSLPSDQLDVDHQPVTPSSMMWDSYMRLHSFPDEQQTDASNKKIIGCQRCNMSFDSLRLYYEHLVNHVKLYRCHVCCKNYKQVRAFRAHLLTHEDSNEFICDLCSKSLPTPEEYVTHLKVHGRKDLHICTYCKKYFRDSCTLQTHMWIHTGEKPFKCGTCGKAFRQSGTLSRHMKVHSNS